MRVIDVDAHFHEPVDWLQVSRPALAEQLPPPPRFMETLSLAHSGIMATLPEDFPLPEDPLDLMTNEFRVHGEKTAVLQPDHYDPAASDPFYRGPARLEHCDAVGVDVQWLSPTFGFGATLQAMMGGKMHLLRDLDEAWNTWASEQVE